MDLRTSTFGFLMILLAGSSAVFVNNNFKMELMVNGTVTIASVEAFYDQFDRTTEGVTRCSFVSLMTSKYAMKEQDASSWFDMMQTEGGQFMNLTEFRAEILGVKTALTTTEFNSFLSKLMAEIDAVEKEPHRYTGSDNKPVIETFEVAEWSNFVDANNDGTVTPEEISDAMWTLDTSGDNGIKRCEFISSMTSRYQQHPVVSNKVYDVIFKSRDITWSDADSSFLIVSIPSTSSNDTVTKTEFLRYFENLNQGQSGKMTQSAAPYTSGNTADTFRSDKLCMLSSILVTFLVLCYRTTSRTL